MEWTWKLEGEKQELVNHEPKKTNIKGNIYVFIYMHTYTHI